MKTLSRASRVVGLMVSLACLPLTAHGAMGNLATTYGVLPSDVASAQALSLFNGQVSATYYNPAYLASDDRGELTGALLHGDHDLRAAAGTSNGFQVRQGETLLDEPTQHTIIGMKTNLTSLTKFERPLYLGFVAGVEKYGSEMLAFESRTSLEGQYLTYGREPLFLNLGGALSPIDGLMLGGSARITLHSEAELVAQTDLAGNTQYESLNVSAKPSIRPVLGAAADLATLFCDSEDCLLDGVELAFSFRGYSNTKTSVSANTVIPGTIPSPGLTIALTTLDSYQPDIFTFGAQYKRDRWRVGVALEKQNWSDLEDELTRDTIKDQANLRFDDIIIPRIGAEWEFHKGMFLTGGVALQKSPLDSIQSLDVNYLDTDKTIIGLGAALELQDPYILAYPVRLEFGYQYQQLDERDFQLTTTDTSNPSNPYATVSAEGEVHVFSGSLTLKF